MQELNEDQIAYLTNLRHDLHQHPEVSGDERQTSQRIVKELQALGADCIYETLGGHGVAAEFNSGNSGPTVMFRCELDGLPIREISEVPHRSRVSGKGHLCGHDGHIAGLIGVAMGLQVRPSRGRVILLFQPAEETGAGAEAVMNDPRWFEIQPDYAFAYHNVPGLPLGEIGVRSGPSNCASRGLKIKLEGKSSHAAAPEDGLSPAPALSQLILKLPQLSHGAIGDHDFSLVTLTHVNLGEPTFGISPADGELRVTLRSMTDERMERLMVDACALVDEYARDLNPKLSWHDVFLSVSNDTIANTIVTNAARRQESKFCELEKPFRWSEDFGRIGRGDTKSSLIYIGAGEKHPQLHNPDYDFPDALTPIASRLFLEIADQILNRAA